LHFLFSQTKGLSLEQIDIMYQHTIPMRSESYRAKLIAEDLHASDAAALDKIDGPDSSKEKV
jgi:hypothetical protein